MSSYELSSYQKDILDFVQNSNSNLLVDAKAGAGKTSTLVMMTNEIINQNKKAVFLAFNKSIVQELQTKITDDHILISTVHSLGLRFIKSYLYRKYNKNYEIEIDANRNKPILIKYMNEICLETFTQANSDLSSDDLKELSNKVVSEMGFLLNYGRAHNINYHDSDMVIDTMKKCCNRLKDYITIGMEQFPLVIEKTLDEVKQTFENPPSENGVPYFILDYTDMIYFPVLYQMNVPYSIKDQIDYVLVDECQDLSVLQQMFIKRLNNGSNKFIFVGDRNQCQPKGTKVLMSDMSLKNIEDIQIGDSVISYFDKRHPHFSNKNNNRFVVKNKKQNKADKLYKVILDDNLTSSYTYNHICYARIRKDKINGYIVYLMKNNDGYYRIGKAKMFVSGFRGFGLRLRLRQENCSKAWILKYCDNDLEAWKLEQQLSIKYGIPQLIFHKVTNNQRLSYEIMQEIHEYTGKDEIEKRIINLLKDFNRSIEFPFISIYDNRHISHLHNFNIEACNIIPEIMQFIIRDENNLNYRKQIKATYVNIKELQILEGNFDTYCLDVDISNNYIADNILTHNCIYGFAGSDTSSVDNLKKVFEPKELPLNICYRCPEKIIKMAQHIVPSIEWNKAREDKGVVECVDFKDISKRLTPDSLILARTNRDLVSIYKDLLLNQKIKIKFRNKELVNSICNEITQVIKDYITRYNKCINVETSLYSQLKEEGIDRKSKDPNIKKYILNKYKKLIKSNKQTNKVINKSNHTIDYLITCMDEYVNYGNYEDKSDLLTSYLDLVESLIVEFKKDESSIFVRDLILYINKFLSGNLEDNVPTLASVHSMKGGEADIVYIYDYPRFPYKFKDQSKEEEQQEKNLQYVALTRAKKELYLCLQDNPEFDEGITKSNLTLESYVNWLNKTVK